MIYGYLQDKIYKEIADRIIEEFNGDDNFIGIIIDLCSKSFSDEDFVSEFIGEEVFKNDSDGIEHMFANNFDGGGVELYNSVYRGRYNKEHYYVGIGNDDKIYSFDKEDVVEFIVRNYMKDVLFICGDDLGWDRVFESLYR